MTSNSSMWIEVNTSSRAMRSEIRIESSKLYPCQGMKATSTFRPSASSPTWVDGPSAMMSPALTRSPTFTSGRWVMQVFWLERWNFCRL